MDTDSGSTPNPKLPALVRGYRKILPPLPIPSLPSVPTDSGSYRSISSITPQTTHAVTPNPSENVSVFSHAQSRLRQPRRSASEKMAEKFQFMEDLLSDLPFDNLGDFLATLFYNRPHGESDPRGSTHSAVVGRFLHGADTKRRSDILPLIYRHRSSYPSINSAHADEQERMFATTGELEDIHNAQPYMSTWATRLVAVEIRRQVGRLTTDDPVDPSHHVQLRATTNGRGKGHVVTWRDFSYWSLRRLESRYKRPGKGDLPMFMFEAASAPKFVDGVAIVRQRRPHPIIQVGAMASFIISRNRYANGDLALILGIWHFACKSHVDVKRVYCRFGNFVADSTARDALNSMTIASLAELREDVRKALARGEMEHCLLLDNVQEYVPVYEQGIGRVSEMKVGTAGTGVGLQDCAPGAFNAAEYQRRVAKKERAKLTTDSLYDDLDWDHIHRVIPLHWTRVLTVYSPRFKHLTKQISAMFREAPIAKHRMRQGRTTPLQPLSTNSGREMSTPGMLRGVGDFKTQMGINAENQKGLLFWIRGDGGSYANLLRLTKYSAPIGNFEDNISTPEIWHTGSTDLNSTSANHYGPATSSDPSSLSKCSNTAGLKRPSNIKSCDYYPTVRNLTLIWEAHVLDCWRLYYNTDNLYDYIEGLAATNQLPTLESILEDARILCERYTSQAAILRSLSAATSTSSEQGNKVPEGSPWVAPFQSATATTSGARPTTQTADDAPKIHQELPDFDGDRVLRNSEIFLTDFGWWIEFAHAVPEGDIGRVWEIMKLWIFKFAGSSHQNYMAYLLEVYCLLRYEASSDLRNAILNNWLVAVREELGNWLPGDLQQEHYNRWLEDMVQKHGGEFDDKFYRQTISPNVHHFLRLKEEIETAFSLKRRGKTHTSPHLRDELQLLLTMFKEEEIHFFRAGRSMGHAAVNQFARGCRRLEEAKLGEWLLKSTCLGDFFAELNKTHQQPSENPDDPDEDALMRSESPASSTASDCPSESSIESSGSSRSFVSQLSSVDANEPENDGEDLSDSRLSSGSSVALRIDPDTGRLEHFDGSEEEEEDEEREPEAEDGAGEDEIPDPKLNPYLDEA
ncbi:hypothetical protein DFH09DRAFT_933468 [Mycena vulgaris]|nr:hypothetical protein DFH09DRAFT_933468 [Mycena vulgaris]